MVPPWRYMWSHPGDTCGPTLEIHAVPPWIYMWSHPGYTCGPTLEIHVSHPGGMSKHIVNVCSSSVEQSVSQQQFMSHDVTCKSHEHSEPAENVYNALRQTIYSYHIL